jgi:hypothetical protein
MSSIGRTSPRSSRKQQIEAELRFHRAEHHPLTADGERYVPHRFRDGLYRVANPALGRTKHHAANQIAITADEIAGYLQKGLLRGEISGQVNLVAASEINASIILRS